MNTRTLKLTLICAALALVACLAPRALNTVTRAHAQSTNYSTLAPHVADELLIKIDNSAARTSDAPTSDAHTPAAPDAVRATHERLGARVVEELAGGAWQRVKLPEDVSVAEALKIYAGTPGVFAAQPNYLYSIDKTPNDPRFNELYGMPKINAPAAWDTTTGSPSVVVAVIDTGIKYTHEDLAANIWTNPGETGTDTQGHDKATNGIDDDNDGYVDDVHGYDFANNDPDPSDDDGHGTHCAGTIGATGDNATGVAGVNWHVSLISVKTHDSSGNSTSAKVVAAFNYVTRLKQNGVNVRVTSNSWGGAPEAPAYDQALFDAISAASSADILNVFAAGNDNSDNDVTPFYPASYQIPNLISVAASDQNDNRASFSSYGATSVDLAAPGVSILSTYSNGSYATLSGTSMATPHVAGAAALLAAANPQLSAASLKASLLNSVDVLANWTSDPATGKRLTLTGGRLDIARAISAQTACSYSLNSQGATFTSAGGNSSVGVTAQPNCDWEARSNASWINVNPPAQPSGNGSVGFTVAANTGPVRTGTISVAGLTYTITQASGCTYSITPASLPTFDAVGGEASVQMNTGAGCAWTASSLAPWITITQGASGTGAGTISFEVAPNGGGDQRNGSLLYTSDSFFNVTQHGATFIQFAAATTTASESSPTAQIAVTRTGDRTVASTAIVRTIDDPRAVRCDDTTSAPGVAFARCDYATIVQTVTFAAGETTKTVTVPLIDDSFVEPDETVQIAISRFVENAGPGAQSATTLVIKDNDTPGKPNPIFNTDFFVRQQYLDFLSREPEAGQPWSAVLNNCAPGDASCDRVSVSSAFFLSPEFQLKGLFVFKFYKVSLDRLPTYAEMVADMASVTGGTPEEVRARKAAFADAWVQREDMRSIFLIGPPETFINIMMNRYHLQQITTPDPHNPDGGVKVTLTTNDLINRLNGANGGLTLGQVIRAIADSDEVSAAEFNPAFVAMQYFGYLRRDPDAGGYNAWLQTINANPADARSMVSGFVNSTEYRLRFGNP